MKNHYILHKIIVSFLVFCMLFESAAMNISASGYDADLSIDAYNETKGGNNIASVSYADYSSSNSDNVNPDNNNNEPGNNSDSDNNSGNNSSDSGNIPNTDIVPDTNIVPDNNNSDSGNTSDINNDTGNDNTVSDNNVDLIDTPDDDSDDSEASEIDVDDETISDEDETDFSDNEFLDDIEDAEKAFKDIVSNKDIMALIYMTDVYHVRSLANAESTVVADLQSGHTVYLLGVTITKKAIWYIVQFYVDGVLKQGYVEYGYLAYADEDWLGWDEEYLYKLADSGVIDWAAIGGISSYAASYADVAQFPAGYQKALTELKSAHPLWTFVPMNTNLDFETAVSNEMGEKSLIQNTASNAAKGWVGSLSNTAGWYYAKEAAVSYCMDPRNFLTETYIFQFEQLTFNSSYHTVDAIQTFLSSTFMSGAIPDDSSKRTYSQAFYEIGSNRKISPIHLASRVYQEQGQGTSGLISGTYPGYEGYYNYFNVQANGATTAEVIINGLKYAKQMGWNTRYKSLEGGAATIGNNYILKCQDTQYLQKFNVDSNSPYGLYEHQYMQNIQAPASESSTTKKMYENAGTLNSAFVFKIPVYNNMPGLQLDKTTAQLNKGDTLTLVPSVNGVEIDAAKVTWQSSDSSIVTVVSGIVTALNPGAAIITASYDGHDASCTIVVSNPLKSISLDKETLTLRRPDTVVADTSHLGEDELENNISSAELHVSYEPEDTTDDQTIVWTTSNKNVATVNDGVVTAVASGEAIITAKASKAGGQTAQCKVTVIAPVYNIEFSSLNNIDTILSGQSVNLIAEYFPKDTTSDTTVLWSSSDTSVATVARTQGSVLGISAGTADITASIGGYSASYRITVEDCIVTFMNPDNTTLQTFSVSYGEELSQDIFNDMDNAINTTINDTDDLIFIGWYTGPDGTGSRFEYGAKINQKETIVYPYFTQKNKGFYVVPIGDQTYTGSAIKPTVLVYDGASYDEALSTGGSYEPIQLILNKDYTISYKNNKKVASANSSKAPTITVKGKGNYTGTETITFSIVTKALTDTDITADNITAAYNGKTIKSSPIIYRNGKKLIKNTDYKISYPMTGAGAYRNAGTYPIIITGTGGYHGAITVYETISAKILLSKASIAKIPNQLYDPDQIDANKGIGIEPPLTVTYKKTPLKESTDGGVTGDYIITYKNNFNTGTATATITAVDSEDSIYAGSKSITYKITAVPISKATISGIQPKTYTGLNEDVMQNNISVSLNGTVLTQSTDNGVTGDYILEYKNINKAGTATVTVRGINKYSGTKKQTYKITACDFSQTAASDIVLSYYTEDNAANATNPANQPDTTVDAILPIGSLDEITTPYVKGGSKPIVLISYKGTPLVLGQDYTIKYKNNNAVTTSAIPENKLPTITITGKGLFKGSLSGSFKITDGIMSDNNSKITMTAKDVVYKTKKDSYKTSITLTDVNGKKLQAGKDYDKTLVYTYVLDTTISDVQGNNIDRNAGDKVSENDIPPAGTAIRVAVKGMGAYAGTQESGASKSAIYYIAAADISKAKVTITSKTYDSGRPVTLTENDITVTLDGKTLVLKKDGEEEDGDYEIDVDTYVNNCNKGKASVVIKGTGTNYGGTKKVSFTIKSKLLSWFK